MHGVEKLKRNRIAGLHFIMNSLKAVKVMRDAIQPGGLTRCLCVKMLLEEHEWWLGARLQKLNNTERVY